jgi:hypothetical protein
VADILGMARTPRIHDPGACDHVIGRGTQGRLIFRDTADYHHYLQVLQVGVACSHADSLTID